MIKVKDLSKTYKTPKTEPGLSGFVRSVLNRQYKEVPAVKNISFEIGEGELVGFLGPNGAGKTTTMKMLTGVLYPTSGSINVLGHVPFEKDHEYLRQIAFIMGQRSQLQWELPAMDTFRLNQAIYGIPDKQFNETVNTLAELLDAKGFIDQPAKTLSLGQRMKMELIATLVHRPKVLFLDEPTIGLDVVAQKVIRDFIQEYQRQYKSTILLTSHYMEDVRKLADRVIIIDHGSLVYDGKLDKLVKKYASTRTIEIVVEEMPTTKALEKVGGKPEVDFPRIKYSVKRKDVPDMIHKISKNIKFIDMSIDEENIEDVVRRIFESQ